MTKYRHVWIKFDGLMINLNEIFNNQWNHAWHENNMRWRTRDCTNRLLKQFKLIIQITNEICFMRNCVWKKTDFFPSHLCGDSWKITAYVTFRCKMPFDCLKQTPCYGVHVRIIILMLPHLALKCLYLSACRKCQGYVYVKCEYVSTM